ncbi:GntR family transcriptional regulator [Paraburkholderia flava]|uniref:GntR family transcriptional regulator n=1 Tax=Paraburkholderia flava TaxID=2547393 RepID=UPI001061F683|nr:GntR family transcriptional regulator [Paraburkholderia flava]
MTRSARAALKQPPHTETAAESAIDTQVDTRVDTDQRLRYRLIHDQLKSAIVLGRIAPGLVLLEGPVARIFGTSRVPVRKAFEMLHADGLLHTFEGRGYLVAGPDGPDGHTPEPLRAPLSEASLGFEQAQAPLELPSNSERIYHALEDVVSIAIAFGHYRIDESAAAAAFGVSRSAVREALSRLRDSGLVEKSSYSHWLAGPLTARAVAQDYELRMLLEVAALRASYPKLSREMLESACAEIERAIHDPDSIDADALQRLEITLHVECLQHAPNKKLLGTIDHALMPLTVNHAFFNAFNLHPDPATLAEHRAVLQPLLDGNIDAAADALLDHLRAAQKRTLQRLKVLAVLPEPDLPGYMQRIV